MTIKDASHLWGKDTEETKEQMGDRRAGKMVIGPAGENLVKYAIVISQDRSHGRSGMGAVMGSKNLKGIVARGNRKIELHDPETFKKTIKQWIDMLKGHPRRESLPQVRNVGLPEEHIRSQRPPAKNFSSGTYKDAHMLTGQTLAKPGSSRTPAAVLPHPLRPGRQSGRSRDQGAGIRNPVPAGSNLLINDMDAIIRWNYELDLLGPIRSLRARSWALPRN